ncbi:multidrug ABC transporter permease/ATP-binding protein [Floricoccus tropicus]|uniref:Multidrug ABC transporter permease/ATP-binding protein n=1 Tax=Floricoccus tropicus TaxID=1859473 RepID=A0A1E8GP29_9LACT|nr:ABC transporter ATP-binding protein [Floricoccus tropicus]OFI50020.1 multidrug ABC transporter permease/ATP-binding protein [Floricoccus tropicus]
MSVFKKLTWFFKENKTIYIFGLFFLLLTDVMEVFLPYIIGKTTDLIVGNHLTTSGLLRAVGSLVAVVLIMNIGRFFWQIFLRRGAARLEKDLRQKLFNHYMIMDAPFYQTHRTGELIGLASNDLSAVQRVASGGILMAVDSSVMMILAVSSMIFNSSLKLTILAILPLPLLAYGVSILVPKIKDAFGQSQEAFDKLSNKTQESLRGIKVIKTLGQEDADLQDFKVQVDESIVVNKYLSKIDSMFDPLATIVMTISYVALITIGGAAVLDKSMTIGELVAFSGYLSLLVWPMFALGQVFNVLERGNTSYDRIQEVLNQESHISPDGITSPVQGNLRIDVESFNYPDETEHESSSLENVHVHLEEGESLGIVGPVGSGKTTLIKLIMRQFDSYKGSIKVGDTDIRDYQLANYRKSIGYVPQENFLFSQSIAQNIAFAKTDASMEEIEEAAIKADLHNDILNMPNGYETEVGEQGISLSGGQRQRLAIARAILINPEILILDDALSAVDAKTEKTILATLAKERKNKTTIILAHRLSSVANSSEITVMQNGQITERGTHDELMNKPDWYAKIYNEQQGGQA